jgi:hypothetical protein
MDIIGKEPGRAKKVPCLSGRNSYVSLSAMGDEVADLNHALSAA